MNKFFCLGSACLLNKPKITAQAWLIYTQTNMNKLFIEPSLSCSWSTWFIYSSRSKVGYWWDIWSCGPSTNMSCDVACMFYGWWDCVYFYFILFCVWRDCICWCNLGALRENWFVLQGIYMKFLDLWNAKQKKKKKKKVLNKIIT